MSALAADIGGGSIRAARISGAGEILDRREAPTPADADSGIEVLRGLWDELGAADARGLVVAGGIAKDTDEITQSPNLPGWEGARPGEALDCAVLNDASGATLGEAWRGALRGRSSAVLITLGTGVGGGVLCDGKLWTGATGCAGEIGHVSIAPDGPACPCGSRGCLELYASATAVADAAGSVDGRTAAERARQGDARCGRAFESAGRALGIALAGVVNVLNPEAICVGGGLSAAFDLFEAPLRAELVARAFRLATRELEIVPASLGADAGLYGAARAALLTGD